MPPLSAHGWGCDEMDFSEDKKKPEVGSPCLDGTESHQWDVWHGTVARAVWGELAHTLSQAPYHHPQCPRDSVPQRTSKAVGKDLVAGMIQLKFARLL